MKRILAIALACLLGSQAHAQKISALPAGTTPTGVEIFPAVQASNTVSLSLNQVSAFDLGNLTNTKVVSLFGAACTNGGYALFASGTCSSVMQSFQFTPPTGFAYSLVNSNNVWSLVLGYATGQPANQFLATPSSGTGPMAPRNMVSSDIPPINLASSANGGVTNILPISNGGCGQSSAAACINALLPSQAGNTGNALVTNGTTASWSGANATAQSGTFTGTLTGCTSNPSTTFTWYRTGNIAAIEMQYSSAPFYFSCTSNSTAMTLTGLPAIISTSLISPTVPTAYLINANNLALHGSATVTGNVVQFNLSVVLASIYVQDTANNFTSSSVKGLNAGWAIVYPLQ